MEKLTEQRKNYAAELQRTEQQLEQLLAKREQLKGAIFALDTLAQASKATESEEVLTEEVQEEGA